jgi:glycosyltransferase involved in cell wall biosynthesis
MRSPVSAVIITHNEAPRIADCLASVSFCDEILVVDSGSNDGTQSICKERRARVIEQTWLGYGAQKRFAVAQASHDWVLCIDADEIVSDLLRSNIEYALANGGASAYELPRRNRFMGRWLRFGEGYPDWCLRLFDRRVANWTNDTVHERVTTEAIVQRLNGDLMHDSACSLERYLEKQNRYTSLQADALIDAGKRVGTLTVVLSPLARFLKFYFLRQGFRDGLPGLVHISIGCFNSFCKYAKVAAVAQRAAPRIAEHPALAD